MQVHYGAVRPIRVFGPQRFLNAIRAGGVVGISQPRDAAGAGYGLRHLGLCTGNHDAADFSLHSAAPNLHDHRRARDVRQHFARQASRGQAGRN